MPGDRLQSQRRDRRAAPASGLRGEQQAAEERQGLDGAAARHQSAREQQVLALARRLRRPRVRLDAAPAELRLDRERIAGIELPAEPVNRRRLEEVQEEVLLRARARSRRAAAGAAPRASRTRVSRFGRQVLVLVRAEAGRELVGGREDFLRLRQRPTLVERLGEHELGRGAKLTSHQPFFTASASSLRVSVSARRNRPSTMSMRASNAPSRKRGRGDSSATPAARPRSAKRRASPSSPRAWCASAITVSSAPASDGGCSAAMASASAASSSARSGVTAEQADRRLRHAQRAHEHRRRRRQLGDPPLDAVEPPGRAVDVAGGEPRQGVHGAELRMARKRGGGKPRQPRDHRAVLAARQQEVPVALGEPCRPSLSPPARAWWIASPTRPCSSNQAAARRCGLGAAPGSRASSRCAQQLGEQPVIAIPALLLVERLHEQIAGRELGEHRLAAGCRRSPRRTDRR